MIERDKTAALLVVQGTGVTLLGWLGRDSGVSNLIVLGLRCWG